MYVLYICVFMLHVGDVCCMFTCGYVHMCACHGVCLQRVCVHYACSVQAVHVLKFFGLSLVHLINAKQWCRNEGGRS